MRSQKRGKKSKKGKRKKATKENFKNYVITPIKVFIKTHFIIFSILLFFLLIYIISIIYISKIIEKGIEINGISVKVEKARILSPFYGYIKNINIKIYEPETKNILINTYINKISYRSIFPLTIINKIDIKNGDIKIFANNFPKNKKKEDTTKFSIKDLEKVLSISLPITYKISKVELSKINIAIKDKISQQTFMISNISVKDISIKSLNNLKFRLYYKISDYLYTDNKTIKIEVKEIKGNGSFTSLVLLTNSIFKVSTSINNVKLFNIKKELISIGNIENKLNIRVKNKIISIEDIPMYSNIYINNILLKGIYPQKGDIKLIGKLNLNDINKIKAQILLKNKEFANITLNFNKDIIFASLLTKNYNFKLKKEIIEPFNPENIDFDYITLSLKPTYIFLTIYPNYIRINRLNTGMAITSNAIKILDGRYKVYKIAISKVSTKNFLITPLYFNGYINAKGNMDARYIIRVSNINFFSSIDFKKNFYPYIYTKASIKYKKNFIKTNIIVSFPKKKYKSIKEFLENQKMKIKLGYKLSLNDFKNVLPDNRLLILKQINGELSFQKNYKLFKYNLITSIAQDTIYLYGKGSLNISEDLTKLKVKDSNFVNSEFFFNKTYINLAFNIKKNSIDIKGTNHSSVKFKNSLWNKMKYYSQIFIKDSIINNINISSNGTIKNNISYYGKIDLNTLKSILSLNINTSGDIDLFKISYDTLDVKINKISIYNYSYLKLNKNSIAGRNILTSTINEIVYDSISILRNLSSSVSLKFKNIFDKIDTVKYFFKSSIKNIANIINSGEINNLSIKNPFTINNNLIAIVILDSLSKHYSEKEQLQYEPYGILTIKNNSKIYLTPNFSSKKLSAYMTPIMISSNTKINSSELGIKNLIKIKGININLPLYQNIMVSPYSISIIKTEKKENIANLTPSFIDSITLIYNYDTISIFNNQFSLYYSNGKFSINKSFGLLLGGNYRVIFNFGLSKTLNIYFDQLDEQLINMLDYTQLNIGSEIKRLNIRFLDKKVKKEELMHKYMKEYYINTNIWITAIGLNPFNNFKKTNINGTIDVSKIGYKAAEVFLDKLYFYLKDINIKFLKTGVTIGYGIDRMIFTIKDNVLSAIAKIRNDRKNIIPFLIQIRPNEYEVITNLYLIDLLRFYVKDYLFNYNIKGEML